MEFIIIFGSAITRNYKWGKFLPSDIDVITNMYEDKVKKIIDEWSMTEFGMTLPLDIHKPTYVIGKVEVPVLKETELTSGYKILFGSPEVYAFIRDNGFASILRIYGNNPEILLQKLKKGEMLSLLPYGSYYDSWDNMDKYYSGLQAFRNAAAHSRLGEIFPYLNCGKLLQKLLSEDPVNWKASLDISDNPLPYGLGWSKAVQIIVSSDLTMPVCNSIGKYPKLTEDEAIKIIFE